MRSWLLMLAALGCHRSAPPPDVDPVTPAQATSFAQTFVKAAMPCDAEKLKPLIDVKAFSARFRHGDVSFAVEGGAYALEQSSAVTEVLCAWQAHAEDYQLLHVRTADGQPRPVLRRILKDARTGVHAVGYDELMLGVSRADHQVHLVDVYSYIQGQWLSELLRSMTDATVAASSDLSDARAIADKVSRARTL